MPTKAVRQARIATLLARHPVRSQRDLARLLAAEGIAAARSTLARDLLELRARKVRNETDELVYTIPPDGGTGAPLDPAPLLPPAAEARLARLAAELLGTVESVDNVVVLRTVAGTAQFLASAIDLARLAGNLGTVAGDDTILVICRDEGHAAEFVASVHAVVDRGR